MILGLYTIALISSLLGFKTFILNYQNTQMDKIEAFLHQYSLYPFASDVFLTIEFSIVLWFILQKRPSWVYVLAFYFVPLGIHYAVGGYPQIVWNIFPLIFYLTIPIIEQILDNKRSDYHEKFSWKIYGKQMLRLLVAMAVTLVLQLMIYVIKAGYFSSNNHVLPLSGFFIYSLEYDLALFVLLLTIALYINGEKGDSEQWTTTQVPGGSSQTTKISSQKLSSRKMTLTKTQRSRLIRFWVTIYIHQLLGFLLLMVLPFLMGKVLEFLTMYFAFALARYILGFKYSLHFKKESTCITVGIIVFGILTLAVPFFYAIMVIAIVYGIGLAVLLHLSYKYKGMWLFSKISKPDKFALLYTYFDGDLEYNHVRRICKLKGLEPVEVDMLSDYTQGNKMLYLAKVYNYSLRMMNYKLDECIDKLLANS